MATALATLEAAQRGNTLLRYVAALAASFRWALEVQRRCGRLSAGGHRLDGDAIRRIAAEAEDWIARH
jgi:hypothetical protein